MTLNRPPESIRAVYQQQLARLAKQLTNRQRQWFREVLRWIVMSRRDLTFLEIASGTFCSKGKYEVDASSEITWIRKQVTKCGALLHIVQAKTAEESTVMIPHESFKRFISAKDDSGPKGPVKQFRIDPIESDTTLALTCLTYLTRLERVEMQECLFITDDMTRASQRALPLFEYASSYWSKHLSAVVRFESLEAALYQFLNHNKLRDWIINVMAYVENAGQSPLSARLTRSVPQSLADMFQWLEKRKLSTRPSNSQMLWTETTENRRQWCGSAAAAAWATIDPYFWASSICCFQAVEELVTGQFSSSSTTKLLDLRKRVETVEALIGDQYKKDTYKWWGNQALVYLFEAGTDREASATVERYLQKILGSSTTTEEAFTLLRLSDCLSGRSNTFNSLDDANQAVEYASEAVKRIPESESLYPDFVSSHAACLLGRAKLCPEPKLVQEDWENAVSLVRMAVLASVNACRTRENKPQLSRRISDFGGTVVKKLTKTPNTGDDKCVHNAVFSMLSVMTEALNLKTEQLTPDIAKAILESKLALIHEVNALLALCRTALRRTGETNTGWWINMGEALLASHRIARISTTDESKSPITVQNSMENLNSAISCFQRAVETGQYYKFAVRNANWWLGNALLDRSQGKDIDEAIESFRLAASIDGNDSAPRLRDVAFALTNRNASGDEAEAMKIYREAVNVVSTDDNLIRQMIASELADLLDKSDSPITQELIDLRRMACRAAHAQGIRQRTFVRFAKVLVSRGEPEDLDECIREFGTLEKERGAPNEERDREEQAWGGLAFLKRQNSDEDIDTAILLFKTVSETSPTEWEYRPACFNSLGQSLVLKGGEANQREAIVAYRNSIKSSKEQSKDGSAGDYNCLGEVLGRWGNSPEEQNEAVKALQKSVELCSDDDEEKPTYLTNLYWVLHNRDAVEDGGEAILACRKAMQLAGSDHVYVHEFSGNLGHALVKWDLERSRDEAIKALEFAVGKATPEYEYLPDWLEDLATALDRHEEATDETDYSQTVGWFPFQAIDDDVRQGITVTVVDLFCPFHSVCDLNRATMCLRKSLLLEPKFLRYRKLEKILLQRYRKLGDIRDLREAGRFIKSRVNYMKSTGDQASEIPLVIFRQGIVALRIALVTGETSCLHEFRSLVDETETAHGYREISELYRLSRILCIRRRSIDIGEYRRGRDINLDGREETGRSSTM
jgi:tetratricopeptide (TPR) repeat protein